MRETNAARQMEVAEQTQTTTETVAEKPKPRGLMLAEAFQATRNQVKNRVDTSFLEDELDYHRKSTPPRFSRITG